jgi:tetratricopeptide (TPR) repeat protein
MTGVSIRRTLAICTVAFGLLCIAVPASAQSGQVKGKVVDAKGQPVEGAVITIANTEMSGRKLTTKTNKKGEYIQIGLQPGKYVITAEKDALKDEKTIDIHLDMAELDFTLAPGQGGGGGGGGAPMSKEEAAKQQAKVAEIRKAFDDAVALSNENKNEEAIAKFNEVAASVPKCAECYANIGTVYSRMKQWDKAEAAFRQAIEAKPDWGEAYSGLANVLNAEKKFDEASQASAQASKLMGSAGTAAGGGSASAVFNQGVILWNSGKIPEAKTQFEQAVKMDPNLADAHYWLGMAYVNEGKLPDAAPHFEEYLKLAPTGQYAEQAKGILSQIKK